MSWIGGYVKRGVVYLNAADLANALYEAGHPDLAKVILQAAEDIRKQR
jgi:hypothetical protein